MMKAKVRIPKVIKSEKAYNEALDRAFEIFEAQPGTPEFDELEVLVILIKNYEDEHHPVLPPDPIEAIKAKMEEMGMKNKDLIPYIGSEGYVSSVLSGNRQLTLAMVRNISQGMHISAEILIGTSLSR